MDTLCVLHSHLSNKWLAVPECCPYAGTAVRQQSRILESGSRFKMYPNLDRVEQPGYRMLHMGDRRQCVHLLVHLSYGQTLQKSTRMLSEGSTLNCEAGMALARTHDSADAHSTKGMLLHVDDTVARFHWQGTVG